MPLTKREIMLRSTNQLSYLKLGGTGTWMPHLNPTRSRFNLSPYPDLSLHYSIVQLTTALYRPVVISTTFVLLNCCIVLHCVALQI